MSISTKIPLRLRFNPACGINLVGAAAFALALAGCGGGGSAATSGTSPQLGGGSTTSPAAFLTLTGTAAVGLALSNATVSAKCSAGAQTGTTTDSGSFSLSIAGGTGPCAIEVDTGASARVTPNGNVPAHTKYHGFILNGEITTTVGTVLSAGTINVTPLTEEILRLALATISPGTFYGQATVSDIASTALASGETQVMNRLAALGATTSGITSLRTQQFTAASSGAAATDPIDKALDLVVNSGTFTVPAPTGTYAVQMKVIDYLNSTSSISGVVSCADATGGTGTTCTSSGQAPGTVVTLTAAPATGYEVSWSGACAGITSNTCQLTMGSDKIASASFPPRGTNVWWVAKTGLDTNNGRTAATAFKTFHKALTTMTAGDKLYIDDGTYSESIGGFGGAYSVWDTSACTAGAVLPPCKVTASGSRGEAPSGTDSAHRTTILGYRPHAVVVDTSTAASGKRIGLEIFKGQHIEVGNIVFKHTPDMGPVHIEQANDVYIHQVGAAYPDPTSNADNNRSQFYVADSNNVVIEDSWAWGYGGRYGIVFHGGTNNVARRNVIRYDGAPDGNPKAGISLYSENNTIAENNIVVDFNGGTDSSADVHAPMFTTSSVPLTSPSLVAGLASVSWYGNVVVNTTGTTNGNFFFDSLTSIGGTITAINNVIAGVGASGGVADAGLWLSNDNGTPHTAVIQHNTIYNTRGPSVRVDAAPPWSAINFSDNLLLKSTDVCFKDLTGAGTRIAATRNQLFGCTSTSVPNDALSIASDPLLSYLLRVDAGSGLGTASDGGNRGATVVKRYVNGTITGTDLWPFPNEASIKLDMCAGPDTGTTSGSAIFTRTHNTTGWCATGKSLTKYVWEQLGSISPY